MNYAGPLMQLSTQELFRHSLLVYVAPFTVPLSWFILYKTRYGLRLRAVGENPAAVDTAGISVVGLRYSAVVIGGVLWCGIAGCIYRNFFRLTLQKICLQDVVLLH